MRTVWHWKNMAKLAALCIGASLAWGIFAALLGIKDSAIATVVGTVVGSGSVVVGLLRWDCWHFEFDA